MTSAESRDSLRPREPKRWDRCDPRLPVADLFDHAVAQRLWDSLPPECQVNHIDKKSMPDIYRGAIRPKKSGHHWLSFGLNFRELPEPMTWEVAWLLYREMQLGRSVTVGSFNSAMRVLRGATTHGTTRGRDAVSILQLTPEEWIHEAQIARMRGAQSGPGSYTSAYHRLRGLQDVLVYPYHRGRWWELDVWNPQLDPRIPQREHEPAGRNVVNFSRLTSPWLREGAKLWLSTNLANSTLSWSSVHTDSTISNGCNGISITAATKGPA